MGFTDSGLFISQTSGLRMWEGSMLDLNLNLNFSKGTWAYTLVSLARIQPADNLHHILLPLISQRIISFKGECGGPTVIPMASGPSSYITWGDPLALISTNSVHLRVIFVLSKWVCGWVNQPIWISLFKAHNIGLPGGFLVARMATCISPEIMIW